MHTDILGNENRIMAAFILSDFLHPLYNAILFTTLFEDPELALIVSEGIIQSRKIEEIFQSDLILFHIFGHV